MKAKREHVFQLEIINFRKRNNGLHAPRMTKVKHAKSAEIAKRWGAKFGTVLHCFKVDTTPYLKNIEFLNLHQEPMEIEIDREEYVLNRAMELTRPRKRFSDKNFDVEVVDKEELL